jgi:hypothetical protein
VPKPTGKDDDKPEGTRKEHPDVKEAGEDVWG